MNMKTLSFFPIIFNFNTLIQLFEDFTRIIKKDMLNLKLIYK